MLREFSSVDVHLQQPVIAGGIAIPEKYSQSCSAQAQKKRAEARFDFSARFRGPIWRSVALLHIAHLRLQVVLQAHLADQIDLGFEEVDVLLGVVQDLLQQVARYIVCLLYTSPSPRD